MKDYTAKLLGLEDVIIKDVENGKHEIHVHIELPRKIHECPRCKALTDKIHDYRLQKVKDMPAFGKVVILHLRKRRYVCPKCGKRFREQNFFLPRYYRSTQRKIVEIIHAFRETVSATHIAKEHHVSVSTVLRYFDLVDYRSYKLPKVLSLDEFKGNAGNEKFQTIVTDAEHHIILDILPNRKAADLINYFNKFQREDRLKVQYVVIDMSSLFYHVAETCFPNAKIITDRYHVSRQANWAMENVRKRIQKSLSDDWRRYCKRSKYLLNKAPDKLTMDEKEKLRIILGISTDLEISYDLKNDFHALMHSSNSVEGRKLLANWLFHAENCRLDEFKACTKAVCNWSEEILNSMDYSFTNGFTEGCNNKTKVLKRVSYGVRKFSRFRNRILLCAAPAKKY